MTKNNEARRFFGTTQEHSKDDDPIQVVTKEVKEESENEKFHKERSAWYEELFRDGQEILAKIKKVKDFRLSSDGFVFDGEQKLGKVMTSEYDSKELNGLIKEIWTAIVEKIPADSNPSTPEGSCDVCGRPKNQNHDCFLESRRPWLALHPKWRYLKSGNYFEGSGGRSLWKIRCFRNLF